MARPIDFDRRDALLDEVVTYVGEHGLANLSLRPLAEHLGVGVNSLMHHFGSKDDLIVAALRRSGEQQQRVEAGWLRRRPAMTQTDLLRAWWRWIISSPQHLALARLGIEAAALEATLGGLPRQVRGEQIGFWRTNIETRFIDEGMPTEVAVVEASLAKAMFTGLVIDLLATGQKTRLTRSLEAGLVRLDGVVASSSRPA